MFRLSVWFGRPVLSGARVHGIVFFFFGVRLYRTSCRFLVARKIQLADGSDRCHGFVWGLCWGGTQKHTQVAYTGCRDVLGCGHCWMNYNISTTWGGPGGLILRRDRGLRPTSTPIIDSPLRQVRDRKMWQEMVEPFEKNYVVWNWWSMGRVELTDWGTQVAALQKWGYRI